MFVEVFENVRQETIGGLYLNKEVQDARQETIGGLYMYKEVQDRHFQHLLNTIC